MPAERTTPCPVCMTAGRLLSVIPGVRLYRLDGELHSVVDMRVDAFCVSCQGRGVIKVADQNDKTE